MTDKASIKRAYKGYIAGGETGKGSFNDLIDQIVDYICGPELPAPEENPALNLQPKVTYVLPNQVDIDSADIVRKNAKIAAGLVFYNDKNVIGRCLDSLKEFDLVIAIDGKYDIAPDGPALSDDGSREIVRSYPNTLLVDMPYRQQTVLRNHYLDEAIWNGCDYLLVIEADEYVTGDMDKFRKNLPVHNKTKRTDIVYNVKMNYVGQNHIVNSPRFFYKPGLIRYGGTHSTYIIEGEPYLASNTENIANNTTLGHIMVHHDETPRTKEQEARAQKYQTMLIKQEKAEREILKRGERFL